MSFNKNFRLIAFVILNVAFCSTLTFSQGKDTKGKLFIIGGGSRPTSMVDRIIKEAGLDKGGYGVILPMSGSEPDSSIYYGKLQFSKLGVDKIFGLQFVKDEKLTKVKLDSIRNAKLIYITGGDQTRFMDVVKGTDIETAIHEAYKKGSLVGGTSAGAAVMSKLMITGNELKHQDYSATFKNIEADNIEITTGLGMITNVIIDQHFVKRSRYNRLISAVIEHPEMIGIGIDEATAILVSGNSAEVVGDSQVIVIRNKKKSVQKYKDRLGAKGLSLDVYLPGEIFKLK